MEFKIENNNSLIEDEDTNCYQISDDDEDNYEKYGDDPKARIGNYEKQWTAEATRALIHVRGSLEDEFTEGRAKRTMLWLQVTQTIHKMGYRHSAAKVQKKWHNILITYNKNLSKKEENAQISWEFFDDMYKYLKGKKAKTEYGGGERESHSNSNSNSSTNKFPKQQQKSSSQYKDHQTQLQEQMQKQHEMIMQRQRQSTSTSSANRYDNPTAPQIRNRPQTSHIEKKDPHGGGNSSSPHNFNDNSNPNDGYDNSNKSLKRPNNDRTQNNDKTKVPRQHQGNQNKNEDFYYEPPVQDRLPLEISHLESGAAAESRFSMNNMIDDDENPNTIGINLDEPFYDSEWWKDYFSKKLDTEKEKIDLQKRMHIDQMNYNKMCLMQQEKIERIKIEAINNLTTTLQKLVEVKKNRKD